MELLTEKREYNYAAYLLSDTNAVSMKVAKYSGENKVDLKENEEFGYCSIIKATENILNKLTQEEFFEGISAPRNKELMRVFKDLRLVEQLGSGVQRILSEYEKMYLNLVLIF